MPCLHQAAKFRPNRTVLGVVMTLYRFSSCRPLRRNFTFGFWLGDVSLFRVSISTSKPNFIGISQCTADVWSFPIRPPYCNCTTGFDFNHMHVILLFCIRLPIFIQIGVSPPELWCYSPIDFQVDGRYGAILLPVSDLVTSLISKGQKHHIAKVTLLFDAKYLINGYRYGHSYYRRRIGKPCLSFWMAPISMTLSDL